MKNSWRLIGLTFILLGMWSCSKTPGKTSSKFNLKVAGIVNLSTGIGSGGALLFGRSANGERFGKVVSATEELLDVPNGDWVFYAVMWDTAVTGKPMNDKVHCAKAPAKLSGTDVTLNLNLTNSNCNDPEFSGGRTYVSGGNIRFADFFVEECDELNAGTAHTCGFGNQGSALSYKLVFRDFKSGSAGGLFFGSGVIASECKKIDLLDVNDLLHKGIEVNFPAGNGSSPFVASLEMFIGNDTCTPDAKGVHTVVFHQGIGTPTPNPAEDRIVNSTNICAATTSTFSGGTAEQNAKKCEDYLGDYAGSCNSSGIPDSIKRFITSADCGGSAFTATNAGIKHLVSIPKSVICDKYINQSSVIGAHAYAGGNGSKERPYKICTEWQINQIGEYTSPLTNSDKFYKLMSDLDMNKTDFGPYAKPSCVGVASSVATDDHYNFNPIAHLFNGSCTTANVSGNQFTGVFFGNNKTISNIRIGADTSVNVGVFRSLGSGGSVRNLFLKNLEVEGKNQVGGIAGSIAPNNASVVNVKITGGQVRGKMNGGSGGSDVGGVVGQMGAGSPVSNISTIKVEDLDVEGILHVGGLVGNLSGGAIKNSLFRGKISQWDSAGNKVGGLVGYASTGSSITRSVSEGMIKSNVPYTGGLVGYNSGSITSSYSTATVVNNSYTGTMFLGGIAGYSDGSLSDVFFDGSLKGAGSATYTIDGIYASGSTSGTSCYSTTVGTSATGCTTSNYIDLRNGSTTPVGFAVNAEWVRTSGSIPRLAIEQRECALTSNQASIASQVSSGRGGVLNPIIICNSTQLSAISGRASTEYYRLAEDINLYPWTTESETVYQFNGTLFGEGRILYSATVGTAAATPQGLVRINTGTIRNLKVYNSTMNSPDPTNPVGMLVGQNDGVLENIEMVENHVIGQTSVGGIAGVNTSGAKINLVDIDGGKVEGTVNAGGVVGKNNVNGVVSRASVNLKIVNKSTPSSFEKFGGVAGMNSGSLDQVSFRGELNFNITTTAADLFAGGIAGLNDGAISNALTESYASVRSRDVDKVGGFVGYNSGTISKSISLGKAIFDNGAIIATPGQAFHSFIGLNDNPGNTTHSYWLLNRTVSQLAFSFPSTTFATGPDRLLTSGTPNFANSVQPGDAADLFEPSNGGGGDQVSELTPITFVTDDTFNLPGPTTLTNGTSLNFYQSYSLSYTTGQMALTSIRNLNTYCSSFSGAVGDEVCSSGEFNIVYRDKVTPANNRGYNRLINYYVALMNKQPPPANSPVWEHSSGDDHPRLIQLLDH